MLKDIVGVKFIGGNFASLNELRLLDPTDGNKVKLVKGSILYGRNGSGKSTFTELLKPPIDYINADEIKKNLKCSDLEAAQLAEKQRQQHVQSMSEFAFETVLSTPRNLNLLKDAKKKGISFAVTMY